MTTPAPGWYPDPADPELNARYWDGAHWTGHVRPKVTPTTPAKPSADVVAAGEPDAFAQPRTAAPAQRPDGGWLQGTHAADPSQLGVQPRRPGQAPGSQSPAGQTFSPAAEADEWNAHDYKAGMPSLARRDDSLTLGAGTIPFPDYPHLNFTSAIGSTSAPVRQRVVPVRKLATGVVAVSLVALAAGAALEWRSNTPTAVARAYFVAAYDPDRAPAFPFLCKKIAATTTAEQVEARLEQQRQNSGGVASIDVSAPESAPSKADGATLFLPYTAELKSGQKLKGVITVVREGQSWRTCGVRTEAA